LKKARNSLQVAQVGASSLPKSPARPEIKQEPEDFKMRRLSGFIPVLIAIGLLALQAPGRPAAKAENQQPGMDGLVRDLMRRIEKLETNAAAMQKRIDDLEAKTSNRTFGCPCPAVRMPPGARPFCFNGMQYWLLPVTARQNP
jgi:hypothetical protein